MRPLLKWIVLPLLLLTLLPLTLLIAISSSEPLAKAPPPLTPAMAQEMKRLARQMQFAIYYSRRHAILLSEAQISALFAVAARALPRLSGEARITPAGGELRLTLHLPENPFGHYLNLRLRVPAVSNGVEIESLAIGHITLPGSLARPLLEGAANLLFGGHEGSQLLDSVEQIRSYPTRLLITYRPTPHLDEKVAAALRRLQPWREAAAPAAEAIRYHYLQLCAQPHGTAPLPLTQPLSTSLTLAAERSRDGGDAARENRAALLALAILFGSERFNTVVGAIDTATLKLCQRRAVQTTLAQRHDLALHFLYSAAIKIISDSRTSFAAGELKEMVDTLSGGSGFSFTDLAADRSGIRFAEVAGSEPGARRLQALAAQLTDEQLFFPAIAGLPEGIPQNQFEERYGGSNGAEYGRLLDEIEQRIASLPLYRHTQ